MSSVPVAGEEFEVLDSLDVARERAEECAEVTRLTRLAAQAAEGKVTLASLATSVAQGAEGGVERHQLNAILKVDVQVVFQPSFSLRVFIYIHNIGLLTNLALSRLRSN